MGISEMCQAVASLYFVFHEKRPNRENRFSLVLLTMCIKVSLFLDQLASQVGPLTFG